MVEKSKLNLILRNVNWPMVFYLSLVHSLAFVGFFRYLTSCKWETWVWSLSLVFWTLVGICGGMHRLWSHRSYQAHWMLRVFYMLLTSIANQGSIYHWVRDHRTHHKYSETDADPHNAKRGFLFSHIGCYLLRKHEKVVEYGRKLDMGDIEKDPIVMFQRKHDPYFNFFMCFMFPAVMAKFLWHENLITSFFVAGCLRYCLVLHNTWLVNSAAHLYGGRPYDNLINPAENRLVAFFSVGEGWHNWHHKFPYDYAASEFGISIQFNPTKLFIDICAYFGLVTNRKRALNAWKSLNDKRIRAQE